MLVQVLIREDRNEHGYIDTSIIGLYRTLTSAQSEEAEQRQHALADGLRVDDFESSDDEWEVSWRVEERDLD